MIIRKTIFRHFNNSCFIPERTDSNKLFASLERGCIFIVAVLLFFLLHEGTALARQPLNILYSGDINGKLKPVKG